WECHVHPEGDKYHRHAQWKTVTPVSPANLAASSLLERAATELIKALGPAQSDDTVEIYLNIPEHRENAVEYCYIDHTNRQVFWARGVSTAELGLECFKSDGFLARVRHINQYGLAPSRLDRLQGLFEYYQSQKEAAFKIALGEAFCLGMSKSTFARLTALWNGGIVYHRDRYRLFEELRMNWITMGVS
ncbi:hypothetical protein FRC00_003681, partial [Tulasnella sp. 408]